MSNNILNVKGQGKWNYERDIDILVFKVKGRDYFKSLGFDKLRLNFDFDVEGYNTGIRIHRATRLFSSSIFKVPAVGLSNIQWFEFHSCIVNQVISVELKFMYKLGQQIKIHGEHFVKDIRKDLRNFRDSEVYCSSRK